MYVLHCMTQARGRRLDGGVEVAALKPCTLTVVEGRWRQVFSFNSPPYCFVLFTVHLASRELRFTLFVRSNVTSWDRAILYILEWFGRGRKQLEIGQAGRRAPLLGNATGTCASGFIQSSKLTALFNSPDRPDAGWGG
jgi:hypothetical protein